ncbi:5-methylaminomethyl-2-thiouridylate-methyltransferase [Guyanagaster necrorhizus]|uniref:tRNA-5-taurinomethyluridine 2-sulfurtransferase n=1 Tax=Guyanagaster necrorhizus TaxID=856835 RepID=A0A9P7VXC2_9AGAR|nr:5-methylaminomethyl-2-thiouridylate-methyltransferase [Guyanagaster necrorhizus MCA 3950]KAG7448328.1 5-methylaminomethyl-2-thiouridylate-methyltransferase [Guyanagaster necrorhizus MCA 3950]
MSGGVDSSVAARLLAEQDFDLSAVFMRNWDTRDESGTDEGCEWKRDWEDVQRVCKVLDIPCRMIDLSREYWNRVFEPSLNIWEAGRTPNPDVWCNREIKFGALFERLPMEDEKAWFATGHYARKTWCNHPRPRPQLRCAKDPIKDQSYYLSSISEQSLARTLFPIGDFTKAQVRDLAKKYDLPTAERPESMGLCFIGEKTRFRDFLSSYLPPNPGPICDHVTQKRVGTHQGLWSYTVGQKARIPGMSEKLFVSGKDENANIIFVVPGGDHPLLLRNTYRPVGWKTIWADSPIPGEAFRGMTKIRHRQPLVPCTVSCDEHGLLITTDIPQKGVATGQVIAVWDGDWCLGCGLVSSTSYVGELRLQERASASSSEEKSGNYTERMESRYVPPKRSSPKCQFPSSSRLSYG